MGPDADVYNSTEPFPGEPVEEGEATSSWGWKVYQVMVWPLEYVPAKREVWLYESLDISLELGPSMEAEQEILPRGRQQQEEWVAELEMVVVNPEEIQPQAPGVFGPVLNPKRWILILPGYPEREGRDTWIDTFDPLVEWRQTQGLETEVVYVKQITTASGEAAVQDIRDYLQDQHANHGARWACLVGDHEMIPWTYEVPEYVGTPSGNQSQWDYDIPHDWCYCDLDGEWPGGYDWAPELWVGRVPCMSIEEAANYVAKVLDYEQDPGGGNPEYLTRAFYESADQLTDWNTCEQVIADQDTLVEATLWRELPSGSSPDPEFPWASEVVEELSTTHYNFVTVHCHGGPNNYATMSEGYTQVRDNFELSDIDSLTNEDFYYYWYSISCRNAALDIETHYPDPIPAVRTIAEGATCIYANRCAVAFAGNTRFGLVSEQGTLSTRLQRFAWNLLFPQGPLTPSYFNHAGGIEATSKYRAAQGGYNWPSAKYVRYSHNLFADPATPIWAPRSMPPVGRPVNGEPRPPLQRTRLVSCRTDRLESVDARIWFWNATTGQVSIDAYDIAGRLVSRIRSGCQGPGLHATSWNTTLLPSGVYVIRLEADAARDARRVVILR